MRTCTDRLALFVEKTMPDTLVLLKLEHEHAEQLLVLMEEQLEFTPRFDLDVLGDIAAYFLDYPDQCHHPVEDMVYWRMHSRDPAHTLPLAPLLEDHAHISDVTKSLARLIEQAAWDGTVLHKRLPDQIRYFVDCYRNHMNAEEREFFPLAEALLSDEDWDALDYQLFDRADPLYDTNAESRFGALRRKIEKESATSLQRAAALREARWLRELHSVATFNAQMSRARQPYVLMSHVRGGFSLCANDDVIIDIPPCSETRAAWCAWFYVQSHAQNDVERRLRA